MGNSVNENHQELNEYLDRYVECRMGMECSRDNVARLLMDVFKSSSSQAMTLAEGMCEAAYRLYMKDN